MACVQLSYEGHTKVEGHSKGFATGNSSRKYDHLNLKLSALLSATFKLR